MIATTNWRQPMQGELETVESKTDDFAIDVDWALLQLPKWLRWVSRKVFGL